MGSTGIMVWFGSKFLKNTLFTFRNWRMYLHWVYVLGLVLIGTRISRAAGEQTRPVRFVRFGNGEMRE